MLRVCSVALMALIVSVPKYGQGQSASKSDSSSGGDKNGVVPPPPASRYHQYGLDLGSGAISGRLPFDVPFTLSGGAAPDLQQVDIWYAKTSLLAHGACGETIPRVQDIYDVTIAGDGVPAVLGGLQSQGYLSKIEAVGAASTTARIQLASADSRPFLSALDSARLKAVHFVSPPQIGHLHHAIWVRPGAPANAFTLPIGPIDPNTDYTFCLRTVSKLSKEASVMSTTNATQAVSKALNQFIADNNNGAFASAAILAVRTALIRGVTAQYRSRCDPRVCF